MKKVYVVKQLERELQSAFSNLGEAEKYLAELVREYPEPLSKMTPKAPGDATIYVDFGAEEFVFALEEVIIRSD